MYCFQLNVLIPVKKFQDLIDNIDTTLRGLELCDETPNGWPSIITYFVFSRLDDQTKTDWKKTLCDRTKYPTWQNLRTFLRTQAIAVKSSNFSFTQPKREPKPTENKGAYAVVKRSCVICGKSHLLIDCKKFSSLSPSQRLEKINYFKLCPNCFNSGHTNYECKLRKVCRTCNRKHHTLLHIDRQKPKYSESTKLSIENPNSEKSNAEKYQCEVATKIATTITLHAIPSMLKTILLPSAVVKFYVDEIFGILRVLMDNCSQVTLISDLFVRRHNLPTFKTNNPINLAVGGVKMSTSRQCQLTLRSRFNDFEITIVAEVVPKKALSYAISNLSMAEMSNKLRKFNLADPVFRKDMVDISEIDLLVGAADLPAILLSGMKKCRDCVLQNTQFGWTILGPVTRKPEISNEDKQPTTSCMLAIQDIDERLKMFWQTEEPPEFNSSN